MTQDPLNQETADATLGDVDLLAVAVRRTAGPTGVAAAVRSFPRSGIARRRVLDHIHRCGEHGAIDEEIQVALRMGHNTQTPRRRELVLGGWIVDSGRTRLTDSTGSPSIVWVLTPSATRRLRDEVAA